MSDFKVGIKKVGVHLLIILAITFGLLFVFLRFIFLIIPIMGSL
ncbi:hypothetical protein ADICYQ_1695 [Cyclobacterium qasimii M12-11B]|uniref:Uncharacterized protein n=1 Tax=Cyclobacterium qasimii M12-11B TaxID=641524 RepID=S7VG78_9BACT|nr:hypothetical protein ADICYQ_1695 [Cyclobacterium qasimii M12-11B]